MNFKLGFAFVAFIAVSAVNADTFATFADPAADGSTPLFHVENGPLQISGSWLSDGLTLETPGLGGGSVSNAHFTMSAVPYVYIIPGQAAKVGPGVINFTTSTNAPLFSISFDSAIWTFSDFGASSLAGDNVRFSGPPLANNMVAPFGKQSTQGSFGFAFANQKGDGNGGFTATASFTSSTNAVPEPASMAALAIGAAALYRRRQRR